MLALTRSKLIKYIDGRLLIEVTIYSACWVPLIIMYSETSQSIPSLLI